MVTKAKVRLCFDTIIRMIRFITFGLISANVFITVSLQSDCHKNGIMIVIIEICYNLEIFMTIL